MEILPPKEPNRKTSKRVRFDLPDEADKVPLPDIKRKKSPDAILNRKYRLRKPILRKVQLLVMPKRLGSTEQNLVVDNQRQNLLTTTHNLSAAQESSGSEMIQEDIDLNDNFVLDKNENCVVRTDNCKSVKHSNFVLRKSKSVGMRCNGKRQLNGRCQKKRKVVISKKSRLMGNSFTKHTRGRKRKRGDSCKSAPKKRKLSGGKLKVGKNPPIERRKQQSKSKQCKNKSKRNTSKVKRVQKGRRSSKVKTVQKKVKKAADNLRKASKKRLQKSRYSKRMKKAAQKKLSWKKSSAKKRKVNKTKSTLKKNKVVSKRKGRQRRRKIRIIKTERELDVIEPLRVSLLKYLTFEEAYKSKHDCCRKYCWDDWEEIDMEDIIDDYD